MNDYRVFYVLDICVTKKKTVLVKCVCYIY